MMAETGHSDDNGESSFEFINEAGSHQERSEVLVSQNVSAAVVGNVPPPSALPSFAALPPQAPASGEIPGGGVVSEPTPPPPQHVTATASGNPFSVRAGGGTALTSSAGHHVPPPSLPSSPASNMTAAYNPPLPTPPPPIPTLSATATTFNPSVADPGVTSYGLDIPFEIGSQPNDPSSPLSLSSYQQPPGAGVWGWFNKTLQNSDFLTKVAEKAKASVDNMITTLDPQMKDYMSATGVLELVVVTGDVELISSVKNGFSVYFPQTIVRGIPPSYSSVLAAQPVGYENGFRAAFEKITHLRQSGLASTNSVLVAENTFLVEMSADNWYEFFCVVVSDAGRSVDVHAYSQPIPVPHYAVDLIKHQTPSDYANLQSGFAVNVDHVMAHAHGLTNVYSWQEQFGGVSRSDLIKNACASAAYLYKSRI